MMYQTLTLSALVSLAAAAQDRKEQALWRGELCLLVMSRRIRICTPTVMMSVQSWDIIQAEINAQQLNEWMHMNLTRLVAACLYTVFLKMKAAFWTRVVIAEWKWRTLCCQAFCMETERVVDWLMSSKMPVIPPLWAVLLTWIASIVSRLFSPTNVDAFEIYVHDISCVVRGDRHIEDQEQVLASLWRKLQPDDHVGTSIVTDEHVWQCILEVFRAEADVFFVGDTVIEAETM